MALGVPVAGSGGDNITHIGAIRLRVTGSGLLRPTIFTQDRVTSQTLGPITMASANAYSPLRLCNFVSQYGVLRLETTEINETFRINRIIIYAKTLYTMIPG